MRIQQQYQTSLYSVCSGHNVVHSCEIRKFYGDKNAQPQQHVFDVATLNDLRSLMSEPCTEIN